MSSKKIIVFIILFGFIMLPIGCKKKEDDAAINNGTKFLYISSGVCNSGSGITSFSSSTSSKMVSKLNMNSKMLSTVLDLSAPYQGGAFAPETGVQSVIDQGTNLLILTENAVNMGERKIFTVPKTAPYNTAIFSNDVLAFTATAGHIMRGMEVDSDGTFIFSKSIALEKIGTNALRIPIGANPWVNAPAGTCATSTTFMSAVEVLPAYTGTTNGKIIFAHQGTTAATNRLGIISHNGYTAAASCLNGYQITATAHTNAPGVTGPVTFNGTNGVSPTAMVYIAPTGAAVTGSLIVAYSASVNTDLNNGTNLVYAIVKWTVTESSDTAATLSSPVVLYNNFTNIFGISAMAYDAEDSSLYVATASQAGVANQTTAGYGYKVEKFTLDLTTPALTLVRPNNLPYMDRSSATKCITSLAIGREY